MPSESQRASWKPIRFFFRFPFDCDLAFAVTADEQVRIQIVDDVLVRRGREHADARAARQLPQVEGDDLRERPVEEGGEFVEEKNVLSGER